MRVVNRGHFVTMLLYNRKFMVANDSDLGNSDGSVADGADGGVGADGGAGADGGSGTDGGAGADGGTILRGVEV